MNGLTLTTKNVLGVKLIRKEREMKNVILALDGIDFKSSLKILKEVQDQIHGIKINHTLLSHLPDYIKDGNRVFVDLKLYDIPNTVEKVIEWLINQKAHMTTVHFENGEDCLQRISHLTKDIELLIVSRLTSFEADETRQNSIYAHMKTTELYSKFNVVLSPMDLKQFNNFDIDHKFKRYCPGIRFEKEPERYYEWMLWKMSLDDQVRISTPEYAIENGADYLIIGRPLINAIKSGTVTNLSHRLK